MELNSNKDRKDILVSSKTKSSSASVSSSTRILESQNVRVSTTFSQGFFPVTMNTSNSFAGGLSKSDFEEQFARDFMKLRLGSMQSPTAGDNIDNTNGVVKMNGNLLKNYGGISLAATSMKTVQTQQQQVFTSSNSCSTGMSSFGDSGNDNKRTEVAARAFASTRGSMSSHSIATNPGFSNFPTSFSNNQLSIMNKGGLIQSKINANGNGSLFNDFSPPLSPERVSFTFPSFNPPSWSHPGGPAFGGDLNLERPDGSLTRVKTSGQTQVSMSESFITSINGSIESFGGRQMVIRQSYGASESESDDDDEFSETTRSIVYRKKQPAALKYQNKLAITDKPAHTPSEDDRSTICSEVESEMSEAIETPRVSIIEEPTTPEHKKCFRVAQELLTTERTYVRILHLIDQEFHFRVDTENRNKTMFPNEIVTQMFCNIKSLYRLHHEHLLPKLEDRLERWEDDPRIGDIMKEFAPFLKMYSEYVQNFDNSINLINYYRDKYPRFANIITEIQKLEACANLPIQHHLIGPIQRIPRYRLLLEAYLKRLPDNSNDRKDSEIALSIVSRAAEHANEAMRRNAVFKKLLEVQEQIKGAIDLVSPTRTLIKEGKVLKISARNDSHQDRYLFLFSDMVLLCSMRAMARIDLISSAPYQLRAKLDVAELSISEGDDLEIANSFYISDDIKRIELYTNTAEEKRAWMEAMYQARTDLMARKSSLRPGSSRLSVDDIGVVEPAKIKSNSVTKCMECDAEFTLTRRRHHCNGCGSVVCDKCSRAKVKMEYGDGKLVRVCDSCKIIMQGKEIEKRNGPEASTPDELIERVQGVLDVPGSVPAVLSGFLDLRLREKKEWTCRWFALRSDFVLYCYTKETDERATTATPIPGMDVAMADELPKNEVSSLPVAERDRVFRITHSRGRKHFFFLAPSVETALNWFDKLKQASKADLNCGGN